MYKPTGTQSSSTEPTQPSKISNQEDVLADNIQACIKQQTLWMRLSPLSVIFFLFKLVSQLINQAFTALMPLGVLIVNADNKSLTIILVVTAFVTLVLLSSFLEYLFFKFQFQSDKVQIHQGVLKKKQRIVAFDKVQNINILQPFYFKPFNLVTLKLETAGSKTSEANLAGISQVQAEAYKQTILDYQKAFGSQTDDDSSLITDNNQPHSVGDLLFQSKMSDIIKYGLTSNGMFWFFVFIAPVFSVLQKSIEGWLTTKVEASVALLGGGIQGGSLLALVVFISIVLLMISFSIIGAIFRYHNYQLNLSKQTLQRKSGLLSTHQESAKLAKIQAFISKTNFIGRYFGVENITLKQASGTINQANAQGNLFIVPSQKPQQVKHLLTKVLGLNVFHSNLKPIHSRYRLKTWLFLMALPVFASAIITLKAGSYWSLAPLSLGVILWPLISLRWKKYGYAIDNEFASFQSGFIGHKRISFALFKAQRVVIKRSPLQRKRNLATLKIYLASLTITIPYMPMDDARYWFDKISQQIETVDSNWF
jgi:putative membrane protein